MSTLIQRLVNDFLSFLPCLASLADRLKNKDVKCACNVQVKLMGEEYNKQ